MMRTGLRERTMGRVASYSMHIDIDLRIDGDWITRMLRLV
jgi:hypothetical protein